MISALRNLVVFSLLATGLAGGARGQDDLDTGQAVTFQASTSLETSPVVAWLWTFEGGLPPTSTSAAPSVTFVTPGEKTVTLTVWDEWERESTTSHEVTVLDPTPTITGFSVVPNPALIGDLVQLSATTGGKAGLPSWVVVGGPPVSGFSPVLNTASMTAGPHLVTFTIAVNGGLLIATQSTTLLLRSGFIRDWKAVCGTSCSFARGEPIPFALTLRDGVVPTYYQYDWDGNGTWDDISGVVQNRHAYASAGTYFPKLKIRLGDGSDSVLIHLAAIEVRADIVNPLLADGFEVGGTGAWCAWSGSSACLLYPRALPDAQTVAEDSNFTTIAVLDSDLAGPPDAVSFEVVAVSQPAHGTAEIANGGATVRYTPDGDYCNSSPGAVRDGFTYALAGSGSTAAVTVTVTCSDDTPVAVNDALSVDEDAGATALPVLTNDLDIDAGPMTITAVTQPANGAVAIISAGAGLTYAPNAGYCNAPPGTSPDTFDYTIQPGNTTATVSVTVTCLDDAPVAVNDAATVDEDAAAAAIDVLGNDTDVDSGPRTIASVAQPANGTVVVAGDGSGLTYEPAADYCNAPPPHDTFTYTLSPGNSTATVSVTVTCLDDEPVAVNDAATVDEDAAATAIDVLANDTDDGGAKSIASASQPTNGSVVIAGDGSGLTYQPNADYCNAPPPYDTFTYTLTPGGTTATVSVTVNCLDDAPTASDDSATVDEDAAATAIDVLTNDGDIDGGTKTIASATQPTNGTVVLAGDGSGLTYQPNADYCNAPPPYDVFTYTLTPGGTTATVSVTVSCLDDAPTASDDSATVDEDAAATAVAVLANDNDVDGGAKTIASATQPTNGTVVVAGDGSGLTYQPNPDYCNAPPATTLDTFIYVLAPDGATATVSMTVTCAPP